MAENLTSLQDIQKPSRPTGVWILTIYAMIFAGIAPLLLLAFLLISGNTDGNAMSVLLSLPISVGVIASAVGAWKGNNKARKSLLVFVTIHYVLVGINNYLLMNSGQVPDEMHARIWGRVFRGLLYPAIYIWYFNKYTTKEFYE